MIRGISALAVVMMHSIHRHNYSQLLPEIEKLLIFATPTFLFMSAFLMFYSYPNYVPNSFLTKRLKYIGIPYLIWSIIYTFATQITYHDQLPTTRKIITNIITGQFHIYFIFIIIQFYLLFILIQRYKLVDKILRSKNIVSIFTINLLYLILFTYIEAPNDLLDPLWQDYYYLLFPAWIFYFVMGVFFAIHFESIKDWINTRKYYIYLLFFMSATIWLSIDFPVNSRRPEILLYTTIIIFFLFSVTLNRKSNPALLLISRYSFGIYLSHPLFYIIFHSYYMKVSPWTYFGINLVIQLSGGIILTHLVSRFTWGHYLIGKVQKSGGYTRYNQKNVTANATTT